MKDGGPPPELAKVAVACGPAAYSARTTTTDAKGNFRVDLEGFNDAPGRGGCRVFAALTGYRSSVLMVDEAAAGRDFAVLIIAPNEDVEGRSVSITTLAAPEPAKKAFAAGTRAAGKKDWTSAKKHLRTAVAEYPAYAEAWHELGAALSEQADPEGARQSYEKSIEADPKFVKPYLGLALLAARRQDWTEMNARTEAVLRLNPLEFPAAYMLNAVAAYNQRRLDAAEKRLRTFVQVGSAPMMARAEQLLGRILAERGQNAEAALHFKKYLDLNPHAPDAAATRERIQALEASGPAASPSHQK